MRRPASFRAGRTSRQKRPAAIRREPVARLDRNSLKPNAIVARSGDTQRASGRLHRQKTGRFRRGASWFTSTLDGGAPETKLLGEALIHKLDVGNALLEFGRVDWLKCDAVDLDWDGRCI